MSEQDVERARITSVRLKYGDWTNELDKSAFQAYKDASTQLFYWSMYLNAGAAVALLTWTQVSKADITTTKYSIILFGLGAVFSLFAHAFLRSHYLAIIQSIGSSAQLLTFASNIDLQSHEVRATRCSEKTEVTASRLNCRIRLIDRCNNVCLVVSALFFLAGIGVELR